MAKDLVFINHFSSLDFELATKQNLKSGVDNEPQKMLFLCLCLYTYLTLTCPGGTVAI